MEAKRRLGDLSIIHRPFGLGASALVALVIAGCVPPAFRARDATRAPRVEVANLAGPVTTEDIRYATYAVITSGPQSPRQAFYDIAFVAREGKVAIIEGRTGFRNVQLTSTDIPERVKDYLLMSPIIGIVGPRRTFEIGETYDGVMLRPEGRPHFRYRAASWERIGGVEGMLLEVTSVRYGTREMDVAISPDFPLPLYVREYTGKRPVQIVLTAVRRPGAELGRPTRVAGKY